MLPGTSWHSLALRPLRQELAVCREELHRLNRSLIHCLFILLFVSVSFRTPKLTEKGVILQCELEAFQQLATSTDQCGRLQEYSAALEERDHKLSAGDLRCFFHLLESETGTLEVFRMKYLSYMRYKGMLSMLVLNILHNLNHFTQNHQHHTAQCPRQLCTNRQCWIRLGEAKEGGSILPPGEQSPKISTW